MSSKPFANMSHHESINSTSNLNENLNRFDKCDYTLLFSHLSFSIDFTQFQQFASQYLLSASTTTQSASSLDFQNDFKFQYQQQLTYKLCLALAGLLFGLFFSLIGYRFLKVSTFIVGFALGSSILYLILSEQKQLTLIENLIISLSIGVLFAFVALLIQFIGLFLIGITSSLSIVTCILIVIDLFYTNQSAWLCILLLFICATVVASFTLKFQKSLTIFNTSSIGSALLVIAIDFFVENNLLLDYLYELYRVNGNSYNTFERQKALLKSISSEDFLTSTTTRKTSKSYLSASSTTKTVVRKLFDTNHLHKGNNASDTSSLGTGNGALSLVLQLYSSAHARLCWYTWTIFGSFFIFLIITMLVQFLLTGKNYDHRNTWHKLIKGNRRKKSANLEKIRLKSHTTTYATENNGNNNGSGSHSNSHSNPRNRYTESSSSSSSKNESSLSRASDVELINENQNDTILLVDKSKKRVNKYNLAQIENLTVNEKEKVNRKIKSRVHQAHTANNDETSDKASKERKKTSKSKRNQNESTVSTSSTSSSASSTCHLIPQLPASSLADVNNQIIDCSSLLEKASAPPIPNEPVTSTNSMLGTLVPPPVPSAPPPKLPTTLQTSNSMLINKNLSKMNQKRNNSSKDGSSNEKFRHFYQIRRNNGDVLSQEFINNIQNKLSSSSNLNSVTNTNTTSSKISNLNELNEGKKFASLNTDKKK